VKGAALDPVFDGDVVVLTQPINPRGQIPGAAIAAPDGRADGVGYCLFRVSLSR